MYLWFYSGHRKPTEEERDPGIYGNYLKKESCTAGFMNSWRKMEAAAQERVVAYAPLEAKMHKQRCRFSRNFLTVNYIHFTMFVPLYLVCEYA